MTEKEQLILVNRFKLGKEYVKAGELEKADEEFDRCIVQLTEATLREQTEVEGVDIDLWKSRVWTEIEKAGLLPA